MFWFLFIVAIVVLYILLRKPHQYWEELGVPYEKPWFLVGNMGSFVLRQTSMPDYLEYMYKKFNTRYFGMYQFLKPTLVLKDSDLIKQLMIKDFDSFVDHRSLISEENDPLFGKNLFSLKGQKWKDMRSTLSPAFTSSKMKNMFYLISDCAEQFTNYFMKEVGPSETKTVEMKNVFTRYANDVIATCAFGIKVDSLSEQDNEFYAMGKESSTFSGTRNLIFMGFMLSPKLMKMLNIKLFRDKTSSFFRNLVQNTMQTRAKQNIVRPDMINILMEAKRGSLKHDNTNASVDTGFATVEESHIGTGHSKREWTDDDLTAQAVLFFIAGFDTSSTLLSFMSHELAVNEEIQRKLQDEIDLALEQCGGKITYEALLKMKYLDMVMCETLRKWPPAIATDRACTKPFTIEPVEKNEKPVHLMPGSIIWLPIFAIHRDPNFYSNPEKFDPERFSDENKDTINPFTYVPFGVGPRNCIGSRFAILETKAIFFHLLSKFNLVVVKKTKLPLKISKTQFNMTVEGGFWIGIERRDKFKQN